MKLLRKVGSTSQIFQVFIQDSSSTTGAGLTGLTNASGSLTAYYHRDTDTTATAISLVTMTVGTFTSSGFKEIDSTNMPGWYQLCPPNAALASGAASVAIHLKGATNMAPLPIEVDLDGQVDVTLWNGTAVSSPATAGIPDVNVKNMNNVAATSITTINANQGTTQPLNFTGTAGSALVKSDMIDIASAAVSTSSAQIGVNAVNIGGTSQTGRDIGASVLLSAGTGTGQLDFTSGVVKANLVQILATALTETAGQIAAAFKQFFNIASPTSTMNVITTVTTTTTATTATNLTNAPTAGDFTATMKTSLNNATPSVTVSDKTGFSLTSAYDPAKTAAQAGDAMTLTALYAAQLESGTAQAGASGTITLRSGASATDNLYRGQEIEIYGGTGVAQARIITAYVGSTKVATVDEAWITNPDNTSTYRVKHRSPKEDSSQQVTAASVQGNVTGSVGSVTGAVGSVTAGVTVTTNNDKTGYALTSAYDAAKTASQAGDVMKVSSGTGSNQISLSSGAVTVGTNNDKTGYALTSAYDPAKTAAQAGDAMALTSGERTTLTGVIWANATRTLTSFGTLVADVATAVWAAAARTLTAFSFTVTTDVSSTVTTNLDTTVSSRLATSGYTAPPTTAQNADKLLGRNLAGGSDGGRTVQDALRPARNKVVVSGTTVTVYEEDDTTTAWTGTLTTDATANPITAVDPT